MFEARVQRGAMELDATVPGWDENIDLCRLELFDCAECVLGQTFGWFWTGLWRLRGNDGNYPDNFYEDLIVRDDYLLWAMERGFSVSSSGVKYDLWNQLRDAWITLITARRASRVPEPELVAV